MIEKYFDDDQRVLVYKRRYYQWILNFSLRVIVPSLALILAYTLFRVESASIYVAVALLSAGFYVGVFQRQFARLSIKSIAHDVRKGWPEFFRSYFIQYREELFIAQIWAFLTANVIIVDRFFINATNPLMFSEYIFAINVANTVQAFHNLGYVSFRRPELLKSSTSVIKAEFAPLNWLLPLALTSFVLVGCLAADALGYPLSQLDASLLVAISLLYFLHAVSLVAKEMAFWRLKRSVLLAQECVVFLFPISVYLLGYTDPLIIVLATCAGVFIRLVLLILLAHLASKPGSSLRISPVATAPSRPSGRERQSAKAQRP